MSSQTPSNAGPIGHSATTSRKRRRLATDIDNDDLFRELVTPGLDDELNADTPRRLRLSQMMLETAVEDIKEEYTKRGYNVRSKDVYDKVIYEDESIHVKAQVLHLADQLREARQTHEQEIREMTEKYEKERVDHEEELARAIERGARRALFDSEHAVKSILTQIKELLESAPSRGPGAGRIEQQVKALHKIVDQAKEKVAEALKTKQSGENALDANE